MSDPASGAGGPAATLSPAERLAIALGTSDPPAEPEPAESSPPAEPSGQPVPDA